MLSRYLSEGNKIELRALDRKIDEQSEQQRRVYYSEVYNIISEDTMEISMPIEKTKLVLLPVGMKCELVVYNALSLYRCEVRITDRYKSNNVYTLRVELTSELSKHQRREYYRYSCLMDMFVRKLDEQEIAEMEEDTFFDPKPEIPMDKGVIVDISGGGLRFISEQEYELDNILYCTMNLSTDGGRMPFEVYGKVLAVKKIKNQVESFEHRIIFHNMDVRSREKIIRYIFEEERKGRKKDNLM